MRVVKKKQNICVFAFALSVLSVSCAKNDWNAVLESAYAAYGTSDFALARQLVSSIPKSADLSFESRLLEGKCIFFESDYESSYAYFSKLVRHYPSSVEVRLWLLRSAFFSGRTKEMKRMLDSELVRNGGDWRFWYLSVLLSEQNGELDTMLLSLEKCELLLSEGSKVYGKFSMLWDFLGNKEKSVDYKIKESVLLGQREIAK